MMKELTQGAPGGGVPSFSGGDLLQITALCIGTVTVTYASGPVQDLINSSDAMDTLVDILSETAGTKDQRLQMMSQALVQGDKRSIGQGLSHPFAGYVLMQVIEASKSNKAWSEGSTREKLIQELISRLDHLGEFGDVSSLEQYLEECIDHPRDAPSASLRAQAEPFSKIRAHHHQDRCIFRAESGHLGTSPASTRGGDTAWLLANSLCCFVLRNTTMDQNSVLDGKLSEARDTYAYVGWSYVHDLRDLARDHANPESWEDILIG